MALHVASCHEIGFPVGSTFDLVRLVRVTFTSTVAISFRLRESAFWTPHTTSSRRGSQLFRIPRDTVQVDAAAVRSVKEFPICPSFSSVVRRLSLRLSSTATETI